jgi:ABC-type antimicrobial peptide transport system permease subunit
MQRVESIAGSGKVALSRMAPLGNSRSFTDFKLKNVARPMAVQGVSAEYFAVLGIPLLAGRTFAAADADRGVVIVNETLARRFWPGENAVGKSFESGNRRREIAGVVADAQVMTLGPVEPMFFQPFGEGRGGALLVRDDTGSLRRTDLLPKLVAEAEPGATVAVRGMNEQLDRWLGPSRIGAAVAAGLGLVALALATIGVYGIIAYSVEQRRREIGVRMAVGARPSQVVSAVLRGNSRPAVFGVIAGVAAAILASYALRGLFYGISALDGRAWIGVVLVLLAAAVAASVVPARNAARLNPVEALREQ